MAKAATIKIKLVSTADTGYFYVTKKNSRTMTDKLSMKKYDPSRRSMSSSRNTRSSKRTFIRRSSSRPLRAAFSLA